MFDKDDNDVTDRYADQDEQKSKVESPSKLDSSIAQIQQLNARMDGIQQKMESMEAKMNEEEKNDDAAIKNLVKEMKLMKQQIDKLSSHNISPEQQKLKSWLEAEVKLPQYYQAFVKNGIDEISVVAMLEQSNLKDIGIEVIGHQMKILKLAKLFNQNDVVNEGGSTALL